MERKQLRYSVEYLEKQALSEIQKVSSISREKGLKVLAKALLYRDFEHLCESYRLSETHGMFKTDFTLEHTTVPNDVSFGFFFSEYVLSRELRLDPTQAFLLKRNIDFYHCSTSCSSHGNIKYTNLSTFNKYSVKISKKKEFRIISNFPVRLYCQSYSHSFTLLSGDYYESIDALWCDDLAYQNQEYFLYEDKFKKSYIKSIFDTLLSRHHIIIADSLLSSWEEQNSECYQYLKDTYRTYPIFTNSLMGIKRQSLLLPKNGDSLNHRSLVQDQRLPFHKLLKHYRIMNGLSKAQVAKQSGLCYQYIFSLEKGTCKNPSISVISKLAEVFQVNPSQLLPHVSSRKTLK
ncbi:MAG: helix-turn-helix transcriptional regulator [Bacteroidota bacterium]